MFKRLFRHLQFPKSLYHCRTHAPSKTCNIIARREIGIKSNCKYNQNVLMAAGSDIFSKSTQRLKSEKVKQVECPGDSLGPNSKISNSGLELRYQRLNANDPLLNNLFIRVRSKGLYKCKLVMIEGRRLIAEALKCKLKLEALLFSKDDHLRLLLEEIKLLSLVCESPIYKVAQHYLKTWSVLDTPPGLLAVFQRPMENQSIGRTDGLPITVVCDNVREPNNLGSIIRTCAALPCHEIITIKGCCDPWNPKSLRGACGGHFYINIRDNVMWEQLPKVMSEDFSVFIAESNLAKVKSFSFKHKSKGLIVRYDDIYNMAPHSLVIIGGETCGVSTDAYRFLDHSHSESKFVHIPLARGIESLNVTAALTLILYQLKKCISERSKKS